MATETDIEQVAIALYAVRFCDNEPSGPTADKEWRDLPEEIRDYWRTYSRAAIAAIPNPDISMATETNIQRVADAVGKTLQDDGKYAMRMRLSRDEQVRIARNAIAAMARGESPTNPDGPEAHHPIRRQLMNNTDTDAGFTPEQIEGVISKLTKLDRDMLTGKYNGWGSWMWDSGFYMVSLGLGTKSQGSIQFDTPLARAVIAALQSAEAGQS